MEQFDHKAIDPDAPGGEAGVVTFDILRAVIAARQAANPTMLALTRVGGASATSTSDAPSPSLIEMFARGSDSAGGGAFTRAKTMVWQDERHA